MSADGGNFRPLSHADHAQGDPTWSPDGKRLAFGEVPPVSQPVGIHVLELSTSEVKILPESKDYFSPRWSPDGRSIVALHVGDQFLYLFDFNSQRWRRLVGYRSAYPEWSHDGKHVYFVSAKANSRAIFRVRIADAAIENITDLASVEPTPFFMGDWVGLGPDDAPLAVRNLTTEEIYAWDLVVR